MTENDNMTGANAGPSVLGHPWIHKHLLHRQGGSSNLLQLEQVDLGKRLLRHPLTALTQL